MRQRYLWLLGTAVALTGCYDGLRLDAETAAGSAGGPDTAGDSSGDQDSGGSGGEDPGDPASLCPEPSPGKAPIRRLTGFEYSNTIEDLLGDDTRPGDLLLDEGGSGFDNNADVSVVTRLVAQKYMQAAEEVAARATQDVPGLLGCDPVADGDPCLRGWIEDFGLHAWRRPLAADEVDGMLGVYEHALQTLSPEEGVAAVLEAFLQSPFFLYRVEMGADEVSDKAVRLDDWEMASRLSYLLWGSMPDEDLFDAAAAGELSTREEVEAQARRMLDDPRARKMARHFYEQWLGYDQLDVVAKDPGVFVEYDENVAALQRQEVETFIDHVLWEDDASLQTLLTAPYTFVDADLAAFYGVEGVQGSEFVMASDPEVAHTGLLTMGGLMSVHAKTNSTSPVARGLFVRSHLLCQYPPPPPDDVDLTPPEPDPNATTREQYAQHREDPACSGCHELMDPLGFGLENFDGVGRWRTTENDKPIDATGVLVGTNEADGPFDGPRELADRLLQSEEVRQCVARQWFRYAYGRTESKEADACTLTQIDAQFEESGNDLRELLIDLTQTDAFMYRPGGEQ